MRKFITRTSLTIAALLFAIQGHAETGTPCDIAYSFPGTICGGWTSVNPGLNIISFDGPTNQVPEPTTLALMGLGLAGFGFSRRKRKNKDQ
ncbi:PEP-CTERM sorting domain-containing protein [Nitrosomonas sp.]|uniref:PEP-CTERM sorting domain-containing protein n=1 Tax=Nitrosomonas sp. TaxID=42353 RepID=UPI0025F6D4AC|nr:PEP-CTERM sorting domain-containing protein [Nitrosomonas sp.]